MSERTLRGVKDSPPYMRDGRLLTFDDAVVFFNLILGTQLTAQEKQDLVAFQRALPPRRSYDQRRVAALGAAP